MTGVPKGFKIKKREVLYEHDFIRNIHFEFLTETSVPLRDCHED
jgi:hypothetical protein